MSVFSSLSCSLVQGLAWKSWHMYLSAGVSVFTGVASPMLRAILSKSVPSKDTGKNHLNYIYVYLVYDSH